MTTPFASREDEQLLTELYEKYARRVLARCRYLLRNEAEAEDAMHDVLIKVQKNMASFRGDASPLTWITRIATNHCLNMIRAKKAAWHDKYRQEVKLAPAAAEPSARLTESQQLISLVLDKCDRQLAEVAIYYFVDDLTQKEIAELVGISAPTLRKRLRAFVAFARAELKVALPDVEFQDAPI